MVPRAVFDEELFPLLKRKGIISHNSTLQRAWAIIDSHTAMRHRGASAYRMQRQESSDGVDLNVYIEWIETVLKYTLTLHFTSLRSLCITISIIELPSCTLITLYLIALSSVVSFDDALFEQEERETDTKKSKC